MKLNETKPFWAIVSKFPLLYFSIYKSKKRVSFPFKPDRLRWLFWLPTLPIHIDTSLVYL